MLQEIITGVVSGLGGAAILFFGLSRWIGNLWLQSAKAELDQEVETHKAKLRKSEFLFEREYAATLELSAIIREVLPRQTYLEMEWPDACDEMASRFPETEKSLVGFLQRHSASLTEEVSELISQAVSLAECGILESGAEPNIAASKSAEDLYNNLRSAEKSMRKILHGQARDSA